ncbi:MAG: hypothetical protein WBP12_01470 [Candidatus Saccharimonas sp.]
MLSKVLYYTQHYAHRAARKAHPMAKGQNKRKEVKKKKASTGAA